MDRKTAISWIFKALELKREEKLFLPFETKEDVSKALTLFRKELLVFYTINPNSTERIIVKPTFKDGRFWIVLLKKPSEGDIAFKKGEDGKVTKVNLT